MQNFSNPSGRKVNETEELSVIATLSNKVIIWIYNPIKFLNNFLIYLACSHTDAESHFFPYNIWLLVHCSHLISLALTLVYKSNTNVSEGTLINLKALIFFKLNEKFGFENMKKGGQEMITPDCIFHRRSGTQGPPESLRNKQSYKIINCVFLP